MDIKQWGPTIGTPPDEGDVRGDDIDGDGHPTTGEIEIFFSAELMKRIKGDEIIDDEPYPEPGDDGSEPGPRPKDRDTQTGYPDLATEVGEGEPQPSVESKLLSLYNHTPSD